MINITAATGQLGQLIVKQLVEQLKSTSQISVTVRDPNKAAEFAKAGIKVHQADYSDPEALKAAFIGTDTLLLISGVAGVEERIQQHRNVVDAAKVAGVKRILYTSFIDPDAKSPFPFAAIHKDTENYIKASGLTWTLLRPGIYADIDRAKQSLQAGVLRAISGDKGISYITRYDLARAAVGAQVGDGHANKTYVITSPASVTYRQFAALVSKISGRDIPFQQITEEQLRAGLEQAHLPEYVIGIVVGLERTVAQGRLEIVGDGVAALTGTPAADFESVLREALA
jgi:NAD(P)H dehydrogenase (quinone)